MTIGDFAGEREHEVAPVMPCGRYQGRKITDLSDLYLRWLSTAEADWLSTELRACIAAECERRRRVEEAEQARQRPRCDGRASRVVAEAIIAAGRRAVALQCHPDVGGTHEQMLTVNATADLLLQRVRAGANAKWNTGW